MAASYSLDGAFIVTNLCAIPLPRIGIIRSGANVVVTWPTNAAGFALQSKTNLVSSAVWTNASPAPVVINTNNVVTNAILTTPSFYRLSK
jgi:hypothetical protein